MKLIANQLISNDSKKLWNLIKSYTGKSFQSIADGPVTILWSDITDALRDTPNNKALGVDGVPSECLETSVVVPVPKKGDLKGPDNY
ncbi:hypothetical protein AYI70_g9852 [Smittium culicis]|uniref:Uncharacterized protein n=1 Tax=Smittium culicis TaxID=133412 RepID=A0A1R1X9F3_9FUNG|nr:hypothetical protein AYI70_g9852 [Smittium culicis]